MKWKNGNMFKWIALGSVAAILVAAVMTYTSYYNGAVRMETAINLSYQDNRQVLATYGLKVVESMKVTGRYAEQTKELVQAAMEGRFGNSKIGSEGQPVTVSYAMRNLSEQYPQLDSKLYLNVQQLVQAGRDEFKNGQKVLLDKCAIYENMQNELFSGFMLRLAGFPTATPKDGVTFDVKCKPITSESSNEAYGKGFDKPLDL